MNKSQEYKEGYNVGETYSWYVDPPVQYPDDDKMQKDFLTGFHHAMEDRLS
jgi:hypothetical protein